MEKRKTFLSDHPAYKKVPPELIEYSVKKKEEDSNQFIFSFQIKNAEKVFLFIREEPAEAFRKIPMTDNGTKGGQEAGDYIYSTTLNLPQGKAEYYFYCENNEAGIFSPERAAHEFHSLGDHP